MKKTLVALAVLGSFAGVASAATSVTLYGTLDAGYEDWNFHKGLKDVGFNDQLVQGGTSEKNSKIGIKGQEDLGNGLAAIFTLEGGIGADVGETNADQLFNRESTVGLKGSFGEVKIGRAKSQMELALGGIVPGHRVADVDLYSVAMTRHSNGLFYSYENSGFSFGADVTTKSGAYGNKGGNVTLLARAAYQNDGTPVTVGTKTVKTQEWGGLLAAVVPFGNNNVTFGVAYAQGKGLASDLGDAKFGVGRIYADKARTLSGVIAAGFGSNDSVYVKYQQRKGTVEGETVYKGNVWAAGYEHNLSKRTSVYADVAYATIKNHPATTEKGNALGYSVGLAHNF